MHLFVESVPADPTDKRIRILYHFINFYSKLNFLSYIPFSIRIQYFPKSKRVTL